MFNPFFTSSDSFFYEPLWSSVFFSFRLERSTSWSGRLWNRLKMAEKKRDGKWIRWSEELQKKTKENHRTKKKVRWRWRCFNFFFGFFNYRFPIINRALDTEDFPSLLLLPEIKETKEKRHFHGVWYADRTAINCCCCCCCCCCCFVVPLPYPFFLFETSKQPLRFGGETIKQRLVAKNSVKAVKTR